MILKIEPYDDSKKSIWDKFVQGSKNATFLFYRDYMDYHRDRFTDHSLMIYDEHDRLFALLPANKARNILISHGGLTYGGILSDMCMKASLMLHVFENILQYLKENKFEKFIYKQIPHIYHKIPSEEDAYALFKFGATVYRRDLSTTVVPEVKIPFQERRLRSVKKAIKSGVKIGISGDFKRYWTVLEENLYTAHGLKPVHSLSEILNLRKYFPECIKLYCAFLAEEVVAGTVIYETANVAHAQYIASTEFGRNIGALDYLFCELITTVFKNKKYFDFGVSTEKEGQYLNIGLSEYKEGFGGRTINYDFYMVTLA